MRKSWHDFVIAITSPPVDFLMRGWVEKQFLRDEMLSDEATVGLDVFGFLMEYGVQGY